MYPNDCMPKTIHLSSQNHFQPLNYTFIFIATYCTSFTEWTPKQEHDFFAWFFFLTFFVLMAKENLQSFSKNRTTGTQFISHTISIHRDVMFSQNMFLRVFVFPLIKCEGLLKSTCKFIQFSCLCFRNMAEVRRKNLWFSPIHWL